MRNSTMFSGSSLFSSGRCLKRLVFLVQNFPISPTPQSRRSAFPSTATNTWLLLSCWQYSFRLAVLVWYFQAFYPASVMLWKFEKWNLSIWHWGWSCANVEDNKLCGTFKERSARAACDCQVVQNHACTMNLCKSLLGCLAHCILIAILLAKFLNETWIARTTAP